jgi:hypothetical protein
MLIDNRPIIFYKLPISEIFMSWEVSQKHKLGAKPFNCMETLCLVFF